MEKRSNLTRRDLSQAINEQLGFPRNSAGELVDEVFTCLKQTLLKKEKIKLVQFGIFTVRQKSARVGRNPRTGETMEITKRCMVSFKASKQLRARINK